MIENSKVRLLIFSSLATILVAVFFSRGLSGSFLLDDFPNLALLSQLPPDASWAQLLNLSSNGMSGFLGRPLAMLSFLLQADSWPGEAFNFKVVNLLIHLINGGLISLICLYIGKINPRYALPAPLIALTAFIWMVHPMQVGNVLYVVQRMNLLASLFTLLGVFGYLWASLNFSKSSQKHYLIFMIGIPPIAALLGLLSKENGVLIYVYLAALELTLLNTESNRYPPNRAKITAVFLPLLIGIVAFLLLLPGMLADYELKTFTLLERVFTQFAVLVSYLFTIFVPLAGSYSLFHDGFPVYDSLFALPVLASFLFIVAGIVFAVRYRAKYAVVSFAVLWFLLGHSLESSLLPLELYFEHRNYLPMLGLSYAMVIGIYWLWQKWEAKRSQTGAVSAILILWLCWVSLQQASIWGDSLEHAYAEVYYRPDSYRAQTHLIQTVSNLGDALTGYELQQEFIASGNARFSDYVRALEFGCLLNGIQYPSTEELQARAQQAQQDFSVISLLNNLINGINAGACQQVPRASLHSVLETLANNPAFAISRADLLQLRALLSAGESNYTLAISLAEESFNIRRDLRVNLLRINWLIEAGNLEIAEESLQEFETEFADEIASREGLAQQIQVLRQGL